MQYRSADLDGPVGYADFGGTGRTLVLVHAGPRAAEADRILRGHGARLRVGAPAPSTV